MSPWSVIDFWCQIAHVLHLNLIVSELSSGVSSHWRSRQNRPPKSFINQPGTQNNHFWMGGNGETTISEVKVWNHPIESTIKKRFFEVPEISCTTMSKCPASGSCKNSWLVKWSTSIERRKFAKTQWQPGQNTNETPFVNNSNNNNNNNSNNSNNNNNKKKKKKKKKKKRKQEQEQEQ